MLPPRLALIQGDNLPIMAAWASASVDLIYMDPPFNTGRDFGEFDDRWVKEPGEDISVTNVKLRTAINTATTLHSGSMGEYGAFMANRLEQCHRLLKPTGSLYLHCDSTASHYLKLLLDGLFGPTGFRNELIWRRHNAKGTASRSFTNNHDIILFYTKGNAYTWHNQYRPYDPEYEATAYHNVEAETGRRYSLHSLLSHSAGDNNPNVTYEWNGVTRTWRWTRERMARMVEEGRVEYSKLGMPLQKRYLDEMPGIPVDTIWDDIERLAGAATERTGYPTQKPEALLTRIIQASSNPGDLVLDPFCGSGTTAVTCEVLRRDWVTIDISPTALDTARKRMGQLGLDVRIDQ